MLILNFSHPLTEKQLRKVEELTQKKIESVKEIKTQFDHKNSFVFQLSKLCNGLSISKKDWQTLPLLVNPPSFNTIACLLIAELHGRMGYFPPLIRLRPVEGILPPQFEVAEIINLQEVRDNARDKR